MKNCRLGILLLALLVTLVTLVGCRNRSNDRNDETTTVTTTDNGSPLVPSDETTETTENTSHSDRETDMTNEHETTPAETDLTETTTTKQETTTTKQETTTTKQETTTTKQETTTTKQETTTTTKATTTTKTPETTTTRAPETTVTSEHTTVTPGTTTNDIVPDGSNTSGNGAVTDNPALSADEWLRLDAFEETHAGAAAYLGKSAEELPVTDILRYFDLPLTAEDITVIDDGDSTDGDGDEWYLLLPRYRDTVVRLHDVETVNGTTVAGELIAESMHPMLVRCDPEDGHPAIMVEMIRGEEKITFELTGEGNFHERLIDLTPAQTNPMRNQTKTRIR